MSPSCFPYKVEQKINYSWMDGWTDGQADGQTDIYWRKMLNLFIWGRGSGQGLMHSRLGSWTLTLTSQGTVLACATKLTQWKTPFQKKKKKKYSWKVKTLTEHLSPSISFFFSSFLLCPSCSVYLRKNFFSLLWSGPAMKSRLASNIWSSCLCLRGAETQACAAMLDTF